MSEIKAPIQPEAAPKQEEQHPSLTFLQAIQRNIFKTRKEADKFLKTPEAKEKKMILWVVRKGGKYPCFMVGTPERIKLEKKRHKQYSKITTDSGKRMAIMMEVLSTVAITAGLAMNHERKRKQDELRRLYSGIISANTIYTIPSEKVNEALEQLAGIKYQKCKLDTMGQDIYVWLLGIKGCGIRENLDLFNVKVTLLLSHDRKKVRHLHFRIYDATKMPPPGEYGFVPGRTLKYAEIKVPGKTGASTVNRVLGRLNRALENIHTPSRSLSRHIRNLYAATNYPKLRKVIPELEEYLGKLHDRMFADEDYKNWGILKVWQCLNALKRISSRWDIPEEKPLAVGVDETARVLKVLISSLEGWKKQLKREKPKKAKK